MVYICDMEEKKQGGKRRGAGRKPVQNKKKQISLYVEGGKILKFGNEEKMKTHLYNLIDEFGQMGKFPEKADYVKPIIFDAPRIDKLIHDEPPMFPQPNISQYDAYYNEIMGANSVVEIEIVVRAIKNDNIPDWQKNKLEKMAIERSKTFDF